MPTSAFSELRVALVHDWLVTDRGGENVLRALCELLPTADLFTLFYRPGVFESPIADRRITVSSLNRIPGAHKYYRYLLPLLPAAIESFTFNEYDLVVSSSHCVAKGVIVPPHVPHICYSHTPMRYVWDRRQDYFTGFKGALLAPILSGLRTWDVASSARVDRFIANSEWVKKRIEKYYRRDAEVIPPFVDLEQYQLSERRREDFYLVVSGFAPYKRIDLAIEACARLNRRLKIVGDGQAKASLVRLGGGKVDFVGRVSRDQLRELYQSARALLFPGEEDFGIVPLEAMASGCPVIAFGRGGAVETVVKGLTGLFFAESSADALGQAILEYEKNIRDFSPLACRARAEEFSKARFLSAMARALTSAL